VTGVTSCREGTLKWITNYMYITLFDTSPLKPKLCMNVLNIVPSNQGTSCDFDTVADAIWVPDPCPFRVLDCSTNVSGTQ
jgi:hypothetical protein